MAQGHISLSVIKPIRGKIKVDCQIKNCIVGTTVPMSMQMILDIQR
jgi:hypothetical protein